jgi:hypothetical protein
VTYALKTDVKGRTRAESVALSAMKRHRPVYRGLATSLCRWPLSFLRLWQGRPSPASFRPLSLASISLLAPLHLSPTRAISRPLETIGGEPRAHSASSGLDRWLAGSFGCPKVAASQVEKGVFSSRVLGHRRAQLWYPWLAVLVLGCWRTSFHCWCAVRLIPSAHTQFVISCWSIQNPGIQLAEPCRPWPLDAGFPVGMTVETRSCV